MKRTAAFTLVEMLIAMAASAIIIGALLMGVTGLHRALLASERGAAGYSDQRRLIDHIARDLRRAIAIAATDAGGAERSVAGESIEISDRESLVLTLPAYYKSNVPADPDFDQPLAVVPAPDGASYGSAAGPAPGVPVVFRRMFMAEEGGACFLREEAGVRTVIVRHAEDFRLRVAVARDGNSCVLEGSYPSAYGRAGTLVLTHDQVMLRNLPADGPR